jgi:glycosyltransferase involved in cell wall biosynthesis
MNRILHLVSAGGGAMRRSVAEYVHAFELTAKEQRMLAPDAEAKVLRTLGVPIESWKPAGLFNVLRSIGALRRSVERYAPDTIVAYGWTAAAVGLGALAPKQASRIIVRLQDPIHHGEMPKPFVEKRLPELLQRAAAVSCAYDSLAQRVVGFGVAPERVSVSPYPIAPGAREPIERMRTRGGPVMGLLQRLEADRAWEIAIDTLAELKPRFPEARLWLAGDGPVVSLVRAYARQRGVVDEISFFGEMPARDVMPGVDLLLVPGSRDAMPYALLEALVLGVPVVAANIPGIADVLAPFPGAWLVPDDGHGFAHGVATVWPDIDLAWDAAQRQRDAAADAFAPEKIFGDLFARCEAVANDRTALPETSDEATA